MHERTHILRVNYSNIYLKLVCSPLSLLCNHKISPIHYFKKTIDLIFYILIFHILLYFITLLYKISRERMPCIYYIVIFSFLGVTNIKKLYTFDGNNVEQVHEKISRFCVIQFNFVRHQMPITDHSRVLRL